MNQLRKNSALAAAALACLLALAGCHHNEATVPPPPPPPAALPPIAPTASISATPGSIHPGQSVVLNWTTTNATAVSISGIGPVPASGTKNVSPTRTTTYKLVARGEGGTTDAQATVTVEQPRPQTSGTSGQLTESEFELHVKPAFFDYDSYRIRPDAQQALSQDASFPRSHPNVNVLIAGYTDDRGSVEYNLALGQNRANSAKAELVRDGVTGSRIRTISYGKERQFCTVDNEACWQQNRRAQLTLDQ